MKDPRYEHTSTTSSGTEETRSLLTYSQLVDHYKGNEEIAKAIKKVKEGEGEGQGFFDNPDCPGCEEARLFAVWCGTTLTKKTQELTRNSTIVEDKDKADKAKKDEIINAPHNELKLTPPSLCTKNGADTGNSVPTRKQRVVKPVTPLQVAAKGAKAAITLASKKILESKTLLPQLRDHQHQWPQEVAKSLSDEIDTVNGAINTLQDILATAKDPTEIDNNLPQFKQHVDRLTHEYEQGRGIFPKPKAKGKAKAGK